MCRRIVMKLVFQLRSASIYTKRTTLRRQMTIKIENRSVYDCRIVRIRYNIRVAKQ